ncbi:MAG: YihY/virulence factor BrkB family protein [Rickettsiales bacterium]
MKNRKKVINFFTKIKDIIFNKVYFLFKVNYDAIYNLIKYDGVEHAGYMSFIILLSLFPFVIFFLKFSSILGAHHIGKNFIELLLINMPSNLIAGIETQLKKLYVLPPQQILNLAIIGLIWTSSSFIESVRTILNKIYNIQTPPSYIFRRFLSILQFFFIVIVIFILMLFWLGLTIGSIIISPLGPEIVIKLKSIFLHVIEPFPYIKNFIKLFNKKYYIYFGNFALSLILFLFVIILYYMTPNTKIKLKEIIPGSIMVIALWIFCAKTLSQYLSYYTQLDIVYGSLGSIIIILLFFYIISIIFIYGAALNFAIKTNLK